MQIAFYIATFWKKGSKRFDPKDYKLKFGESKPLSKEEATRRSKRAWLAGFKAMGTKVRVIKKEED
jgi:hypothetical protein